MKNIDEEKILPKKVLVSNEGNNELEHCLFSEVDSEYVPKRHSKRSTKSSSKGVRWSKENDRKLFISLSVLVKQYGLAMADFTTNTNDA